MADQPVTKKEFVNLEKKVDQLSKSFGTEKQGVHDIVDGLLESVDDLQKSMDQRVSIKWFDDEKKVVHEQLDKVEKWFVDEKKAVHTEIDTLRKWVEDELKKLQKK